MLQRVASADFVDVEEIAACAQPEAAKLAQAMAGCLHPRAGRLMLRLTQNPDPSELGRLRTEVLNLLTLSFGESEALRRLQ